MKMKLGERYICEDGSIVQLAVKLDDRFSQDWLAIAESGDSRFYYDSGKRFQVIDDRTDIARQVPIKEVIYVTPDKSRVFTELSEVPEDVQADPWYREVTADDDMED